MGTFIGQQRLGYLWEKIKNLFATGTAGRAQSIPFGVVDSTSTSTAFTATVEGITDLKDGTCVYLMNGVVTSAAASTAPKCWTLNINNLGAKPVYVTTAKATYSTTHFTKDYKMLFTYDESLNSGNGGWYIGQLFNSNTTYSDMTQAEIDAGTGTTGRKITPKMLRDNFYTEDEVDTLLETKANSNDLATVATTGSYNDLEDTPTIPTVPTNVSAFNNDAGYLTSFTESDPTVPSHVKGITTTDISNWNSKQAAIADLDDIRSGAALSNTYIQILLNDLVDYIYINQNVVDSNTMISGDVNGKVIQYIRKNTHSYLAKNTASGEMTICQLSDADCGLFYDGKTVAPLDGSEGDVFTRCSVPFYTYAEEISENVWKIGFSKYKLSNSWHEWNNNDLIGRYEAYYDENNNMLRSISGVASSANITQTDFKSYARARGNGFSLVKWRHQNIMAFLYYAMYGNTNCQAQIGNGTATYDKNTGLCDSLGMKDGVSSSIVFLGLENWWGNKYEFVDNVIINANKWNIEEDDGTTREVTGQSKYGAWVYPNAWVIGEHLDVIPLPVQEEGTASTGYCDAVYMSGTNSRVVLRSFSHNFQQGGVAEACGLYGASNVGATYGSRLAFTGNIIELSSIESFLNI